MAIGLINFPNIIPSDSDYLSGRIKDDSGANDGTPIDQLTNGDIQEFFAKMMKLASITPNGVFDNEYSGHQYIDALKAATIGAINASYFNGTFTHITLAAGYTSGGDAPSYRKDNFGNVTITGNMSIGSPANNSVGTLPVGFRPATQQIKVIGGAGGGPGIICMLIINTSGGIQIVDTTGADLSSTYTRLNCSFNIMD